MASNCPLPTTRLRQICSEACTAALGTATIYDHSLTAKWNNLIINAVLQHLISDAASLSTPEDGSAAQQYKWIVNTTIIQHLSDPRAGGTNGEAKKVGRRGMHSASGAFWNNEKDGMWSYKHDVNAGGEEKKGMDVVVSVMWVAV